MLVQVASFHCLPLFAAWNIKRHLIGRRSELVLHVDRFLLYLLLVWIFSFIDNDVFQPVQCFWVPAIGSYTGTNLPTRVNGKLIPKDQICCSLASFFHAGFECPQGLCPKETVVQKMAANKRSMGINTSLCLKRPCQPEWLKRYWVLNVFPSCLAALECSWVAFLSSHCLSGDGTVADIWISVY